MKLAPMRTLLVAALSASPVTGISSPHQDSISTPAVACASLTAPSVPGATVLSITSREFHNFSVETFDRRDLSVVTVVLSFCGINTTVTHGSSGDRVRTEFWLPLTDWNGRYQAIGGGGYKAGSGGQIMGPELVKGYASSSTDAGLGENDVTGVDTQFTPQLWENFVHLSVHEMSILGKDLVRQYYGTPANKTYFTGCSNGGRQGMQSAQKYPTDWDGIVAESPAMNWPKFVPTLMWGNLVAMDLGVAPPPICVFDYMVEAAYADCDADDGAVDNVIGAPGLCHFDPTPLVGTTIPCVDPTGGPNTTVTIRPEDAIIFNELHRGAHKPDGTPLWYGLQYGTSLYPQGVDVYPIVTSWLNNQVLTTNFTPTNNAAYVTSANLSSAIYRGIAKFGASISADNPDLSGFQAGGAKLLSWHGLVDQLITANGTFEYAQKVHERMGGAKETDEFYRVFAAPGVEHCFSKRGAFPLNALDTLVKWVEEGVAPETLPAVSEKNGVTTRRNLCRYPYELRYKGSGDVNLAESWHCVIGALHGAIKFNGTETCSARARH